MQGLINRFAAKDKNTWEEETDWSLKDVFPERYYNQVDFLNNKFFTQLSKSTRLLDLACANGEYSILAAEHVQQVDGYDLSKRMIATAKAKATKAGVSNVSFYAEDTLALQLDETYDSIMMLGLLTYIFDDKDALEIIQKLYKALVPGGSLLIKDTLSMLPETLYMFNILTKYKAVYRTEECYFSLFEKAGFSVKTKEILQEINKQGIGAKSIISILKKQ